MAFESLCFHFPVSVIDSFSRGQVYLELSGLMSGQWQ